MLITDFHSHILPGVDHGSDSVETSVKQLSLMHSFGTEVAVATSHYYPTESISVSEYIKLRDVAAGKLLDAVADKNRPRIILASEVLVCPGLENLPDLEKLLISGTDYMLIELPDVSWNGMIFQTLKALGKMGIRVIFAHIDRYPPELVKDILIITKFKAQLNPGAFSSKSVHRRYSGYIDDGTVVALGSDLHMAKKGSYKKFASISAKYRDDFECVMRRTEKIIAGANML